MIELLNLPEFRKRVAPISVDVYHQMIESGAFGEKSYELIEGALIEKISKSHLHSTIVDILLDLLKSFCPRDEFWVRQEAPITLDESESEPDLSVIKGSRADFDSNPTTAQFLIEVAISTLTIDRAKAAGFARAEVPEYWIVRPDAGKIEVFRKPLDGQYSEEQTFKSDQSVESSALPGFSFNLKADLDG